MTGLLPQQQKILDTVLQPERLPVGCRASAGTGKTHLLTEIFVQLTQQGKCKPEDICAVTFSRNAANELDERISQKLPQERGWENLQLNIYTIHGLCKWILSKWGYHLDLPFKLRVWEPIAYEEELKKRIEDWLINLEWDTLSPFLERYNLPQLSMLLLKIHLESLNPWPVTQNASYEELFSKWTKNHLPHGRVLELLENLSTLAEGTTQFEAAVQDYLTEIKDIRETLAVGFNFEGYRLLHSLFVTVFPTAKGKVAKTPVGLAFNEVRKVLKAHPPEKLNPKEFQASQELESLFEEMRQKLEVHLQKVKVQHNICSFRDLEVWAEQIVTQNEDARTQIRQRFPYILLDECQDTNLRQWNIFRTILGPKLEGLFAVGDVKQCLYQFRGADPTAFKAMMNQIEENEGVLFSLENHFRSKEQLLHRINTISSQLFADDAPKLQAFESSTKGRLVHLTAPADLAEAPICAQACLGLHREKDVAYDDIVVLVRNLKTHAQRYVDAFEEAGVPLYIESGHQFFEHPLVLLVRHFFKLSQDPDDDLTLFHLLQLPVFNSTAFDEFTVLREEAGADHMPTLLKDGLACSSDELLDFLFASKEIRDWIEKAPHPAQEWLRLSCIRKLYREYSPPTCMSKDLGFVQYLDQCRTKGATYRLPVNPKGAVTLMTVHGAKGLQSKTVLIPQLYEPPVRAATTTDLLGSRHYCLRAREKNGASRDTLSSLLFKDHDKREQLEENKRIFYVALTRAKDSVYFVDSAARDNPHTEAWIHLVDGEKERLTPQERKSEPSAQLKQEEQFQVLRPQKCAWTVTEVAQTLSNTVHQGKGLSLEQKRKNIEGGIELHEKLERDPDFEQKFWQSIESQTSLPLKFNEARIQREFSVCFHFGCHQFKGKIDSLWLSDEHALFIDYKRTLDRDSLSNPLAHPYTLQLGLYALALGNSLGERRLSCHLVSARNNDIISWDWSPELTEKIKTLLKQHF